MSSRTKGREAALQILYQADSTDGALDEALQLFNLNFTPDGEIKEFASKLVEGVEEHGIEIDALIDKASINWRMDRMPRVDRNVLRIAVYELVHCPEIPLAVVINEAIEIGKRYGSEESGSFINGILDKVAQHIGRT
jgi:N utilization substance protein B